MQHMHATHSSSAVIYWPSMARLAHPGTLSSSLLARSASAHQHAWCIGSTDDDMVPDLGPNRYLCCNAARSWAFVPPQQWASRLCQGTSDTALLLLGPLYLTIATLIATMGGYFSRAASSDATNFHELSALNIDKNELKFDSLAGKVSGANRTTLLQGATRACDQACRPHCLPDTLPASPLFARWCWWLTWRRNEA